MHQAQKTITEAQGSRSLGTVRCFATCGAGFNIETPLQSTAAIMHAHWLYDGGQGYKTPRIRDPIPQITVRFSLVLRVFESRGIQIVPSKRRIVLNQGQNYLSSGHQGEGAAHRRCPGGHWRGPEVHLGEAVRGGPLRAGGEGLSVSGTRELAGRFPTVFPNRMNSSGDAAA